MLTDILRILAWIGFSARDIPKQAIAHYTFMASWIPDICF